MILAEKRAFAPDIKTEYETSLKHEAYVNGVNHQREVTSFSRYRKTLKPFLGIAGFFFCFMVVNLFVQIFVMQCSNEVKNCQEAIQKLERESIQVRIEMAKLESFDRVQTIAQKELGMRVAGPGDYRCIVAAPRLKQNEPRPYIHVVQTTSQNNHLWDKLASWLDGIRTAMAQTP